MKPQARIVKQTNGHKLVAEMRSGRWWFSNPVPGFAKEHDGCEEADAALAEFERLALAGTQPTLFVQEITE
jgi:hypothetical protein